MVKSAPDANKALKSLVLAPGDKEARKVGEF